MRLKKFTIKDQPPIKHVDASEFSNVLVVAGPNGVGKTTLIRMLLDCLRSPGSQSSVSMIVEATNQEERDKWQRNELDTSVPEQAQLLRQHIQRRQFRGKWRSSAYHFDSVRQSYSLQSFQWSWSSLVDPLDDEVGWDYLFGGLGGRFNDTVHTLLRKVATHKRMIADRAMDLQRGGHRTMDLDFPDPLAPFKTAFKLLLAPKQIPDDLDLDRVDLPYELNGQILPTSSLSSGEKEVFVMVFDILLREPEDCIIFIDEPELHLHPELAFRLLKTLQTIGQRNQFVLCTHSAEIISGSMEHSVLLIRPPDGDENQARVMNAASPDVEVLKSLGQSLGVISLGRKIVLVEGTDSSLDRDTYGAIVQGKYPNLVLAPSGSRRSILSFSDSIDNVLNRTVWGIDFFMLADRDASLPESVLLELEKKAGHRLKFLPRYHLENYFLDSATIAEAFKDLESTDSWLRDAQEIERRLKALAAGLISQSVNIWITAQLINNIGNVGGLVRVSGANTVDDFVNQLPSRIVEEKNRVATFLDETAINTSVRQRWSELETALSGSSENWKAVFPGKILIGKFCGEAKITKGRFQNAYIAAARRKDLEPFQEILPIFETWANS